MIQSITSTTNAAPASSEASPKLPRTRRFLGRKVADREPVITSTEIDGAPVLCVETFGRHGGASFVIDEDRWLEISTQRGTQWVLITAYKKRLYVASGRQAATQRHRRNGVTPVITLARLVTGAVKGQHVRFRDGNPLNLTLRNLELLSRPVRMPDRISAA